MENKMIESNANLVEIFSSIQGEGPYIGYNQIFVRFAECNLSCSYCDTKFDINNKFTLSYSDDNNIELSNPINVDDLYEKLKKFNLQKFHSISFTGGEPLLSANFLADLASKIREESSIKLFLETNGTMFKELLGVLDFIDIVSMDIKLKSSTGFEVPYNQHKAFARAVQAMNKELVLKIVVTQNLEIEELQRLVKKNIITKSTGIVIQPVTTNNLALRITNSKLLDVTEFFNNLGIPARVIPQVHTYMNLK